MPQNKRESLIYTVMMCFVMVLWMSIYNVSLQYGGFGLDAVAVCLTDALQALCDLTGQDAADATIDEVFETFCVGK